MRWGLAVIDPQAAATAPQLTKTPMQRVEPVGRESSFQHLFDRRIFGILCQIVAEQLEFPVATQVVCLKSLMDESIEHLTAQ
jgi:hypothetical protein